MSLLNGRNGESDVDDIESRSCIPCFDFGFVVTLDHLDTEYASLNCHVYHVKRQTHLRREILQCKSSGEGRSDGREVRPEDVRLHEFKQ